MNLQWAQGIAAGMMRALRPFCERIEIAGSIRREKRHDIGDVEIICIPRRKRPEFGQPLTLPLLAEIERLRQLEVVSYRYDKNGRKSAGEKYQRLLWGATPLDLFLVTPETWGLGLVIRTGDADFSHRLVTPRQYGGAMPVAWRMDGLRIAIDGEGLLDTPEEADVFNALGLPWIVPHDRTEAVLRKLLKGQLT